MGAEALASIAETLGLDAAKLQSDVTEHHYLERIRTDFNGGIRSGVNGTPTFFINGTRFDGAPTVEELTEALRAAL